LFRRHLQRLRAGLGHGRHPTTALALGNEISFHPHIHTVRVHPTKLADGDHGGHQLETAKGHEGLYGRLEAPGFQEREHGGFDELDALVGGVDALERIAFIGGFRNVDSGELSGAQQAGEVAGVAFIGFERGAGLFGEEGRSGDQAGDFELLQSASNAEAARTGFIGDFPLRAGVSLADADRDALDGLDGVGDGAEKAISPLGPGSAMEMVMESLWTSRPR